MGNIFVNDLVGWLERVLRKLNENITSFLSKRKF